MVVIELLSYIAIILFLLAGFLGLLYTCLILFIRRYHHANNIFIANVCLSITFTTVFAIFTFEYVFYFLSPTQCNFLHFGYNIGTTCIPFAFVAFTVHRVCSVVYYQKAFFKKKQWVAISIASSWVVQCLIASLLFIGNDSIYCFSTTWMNFYVFVTCVILPLIINTLLNIRIFLYVRRSTRRVQPQAFSVSTISTNNQQPRISRRDVSLIKHMVLTFLLFVIGWTPVCISDLSAAITSLNLFAALISSNISALCILGIVIYLFMCNHDVRNDLLNTIRNCFRH